VEDAQGVVVAADDDAVEGLYVDEGLSVAMDAGAAAVCMGFLSVVVLQKRLSLSKVNKYAFSNGTV